MSTEPCSAPQPPQGVLGVAFAQAYDLSGDALRVVGVGGLIHLGQVDPDFGVAVDAVLGMLDKHSSRRLS